MTIGEAKMAAKYNCPMCGSEMRPICEVSATEGKAVVLQTDNVFQCANSSCRYTCDESALQQLYGGQSSSKV